MARNIDVVSCPNGCGSLITPAYKSRYGQCVDCYLPLGEKMKRLNKQCRLNQYLHSSDR